jgi:hypothetical protein
MGGKLLDSICLITSKEPGNKKFGTGFVIFQEENLTYILTCAHVVDDVGGADCVRVSAVDILVDATVIACGCQEESNSKVYLPADMAVLEVSGLSAIPVLNLYPWQNWKKIPVTIVGFCKFISNEDVVGRPLDGALGKQVILQAKDSAVQVKAWDLKIDDEDNLEGGYSGSPLVDDSLGSVFGIVSHRRSGGTKGQSGPPRGSGG